MPLLSYSCCAEHVKAVFQASFGAQNTAAAAAAATAATTARVGVAAGDEAPPTGVAAAVPRPSAAAAVLESGVGAEDAGLTHVLAMPPSPPTNRMLERTHELDQERVKQAHADLSKAASCRGSAPRASRSRAARCPLTSS